MGEADRYMDYKQPRKRFTLGDDNNALVALVTINIAFYILLLVIEAIYASMQGSKTAFVSDVLPWFQLPASLQSFVTRPWTLLTSMFTHIGFWGNMLPNMLWLWTFGFIFQELEDFEYICSYRFATNEPDGIQDSGGSNSSLSDSTNI